MYVFICLYMYKKQSQIVHEDGKDVGCEIRGVGVLSSWTGAASPER